MRDKFEEPAATAALLLLERGGAGGMMGCSAKTLCVVGWTPRRPGANAARIALPGFVETWTLEKPAATASLLCRDTPPPADAAAALCKG